MAVSSLPSLFPWLYRILLLWISLSITTRYTTAVSPNAGKLSHASSSMGNTPPPKPTQVVPLTLPKIHLKKTWRWSRRLTALFTQSKHSHEWPTTDGATTSTTSTVEQWQRRNKKRASYAPTTAPTSNNVIGTTTTTTSTTAADNSNGITAVGWALIAGSITISMILIVFFLGVWCRRCRGSESDNNSRNNINKSKRSPLHQQQQQNQQQQQPSGHHRKGSALSVGEEDDYSHDEENGQLHHNTNNSLQPPSQTSSKKQQQLQQNIHRHRRKPWTVALFGAVGDDDDDDDKEDEEGVELSAPPSNGHADTVVPPVVQLDDDHRSLANTTLGDQTAGRKRKPRKKKRPSTKQTATSSNSKHHQNLDIPQTYSFDESSLYTTPSGAATDHNIVRLPNITTTNIRPHQQTAIPTTPIKQQNNNNNKESGSGDGGVEVFLGKPTGGATTSTFTNTNNNNNNHTTTTGSRSSSSSGPVDIDTALVVVDESSILTPRAPIRDASSPLYALKQMSEEPLILTFEDKDDDDDDEDDRNEVGTVDAEDLLTDADDDTNNHDDSQEVSYQSSTKGGAAAVAVTALSPQSSSSSSAASRLERLILHGLPGGVEEQKRSWPEDNDDGDGDDEEEKHEVELIDIDYFQPEPIIFDADPPGSYWGSRTNITTTTTAGHITTTATTTTTTSTLRKLPPSPLDRKRNNRKRTLATNAASPTMDTRNNSRRQGVGLPPSKSPNQFSNRKHPVDASSQQHLTHQDQASTKATSSRTASLYRGTDENAPPMRFSESASSPVSKNEDLLRGWKHEPPPAVSQGESKELSPVAQHLSQRAALSILAGPVLLKDDKVVEQMDAISVSSSSSTNVSNNPWLFGTLEDTLGPRSPSADLESLGGRSNRSGKSHRSNRSRKSVRSHRSGKSSLASRMSSRKREGTATSVASPSSSKEASSLGGSKGSVDRYKKKNKANSIAPHLKRLERQLAALDQVNADLAVATAEASSRGGNSRSSAASSARRRKVDQMEQHMVVIAPPGKLGVILANRHDGSGTVVSEVKASSVLHGTLVSGDKLIAVDDDDVTGMVVSEIISLMASRSDRERRLTVITTKSNSNSQTQ